jgi:MoaA/NifB/PqqE/SkfB family radical SAM enzyme
MKNKPVLLLIGEVSPVTSEIAEILRSDFTVRLLSPDEPGCNDIEHFTYCVCAVNFDKIDSAIFRKIQSNVIDKSGILLILEHGFEDFGLSEFFRFIGAKTKQEPDCTALKLHVFPHYLTRGIPETVEIDRAVRANLRFCDNFSKISDNVFVEDMDANPLGYERVYGTKGRVIVLAIRRSNGLSELEKGVLSNLCLLQYMAENIDECFCEDITQEIPFRKDVLMEKPDDICRWNTLFNEDKSDITYTHSAIFLPGSPEFCRERITIRSKQGDGEYSREQLEQSFIGVEIRNTDFCTQNCFYCYNRREMDVKYVRTSLPKELHVLLEKDLIKMKKAIEHRFFVRYTGTGEPLNHPETLHSLLAFERNGIPTALITNGELLSIEEASELGHNGSCVRFSVDASNEQTYSAIRRCNINVFEKIKNNIAAVARGKCFVGTTFLVCRENFGQIFDFCNLMKSLGVNAVWIRSTDGCDYFPDVEMKQIEIDIERALTLIDKNFIVVANQFKIYRTISLLHYKYDTVRCWAGHTKAFIQPGGDVIICLSRPDYVIGNLHEQNFSEIWGGERHLHFLKYTDVTTCSQCIESRYNSAVDFLFRNCSQPIYKGTRKLATNYE